MENKINDSIDLLKYSPLAIRNSELMFNQDLDSFLQNQLHNRGVTIGSRLDKLHKAPTQDNWNRVVDGFKRYNRYGNFKTLKNIGTTLSKSAPYVLMLDILFGSGANPAY